MQERTGPLRAATAGVAVCPPRPTAAHREAAAVRDGDRTSAAARPALSGEDSTVPPCA